MLYPWRKTCKPASTQSNVVDWKNLVDLKERNKYLQNDQALLNNHKSNHDIIIKESNNLRFCGLGGLCRNALRTNTFSNFWYETRTLTGIPLIK